jgi:hypothetical protein
MEKKKLSWNEIMDSWEDVCKSYYILECSVTGEKTVYEGFEGLASFLKLKRLYGPNTVKLTKLDKTIAEVLFGPENKKAALE